MILIKRKIDQHYFSQLIFLKRVSAVDRSTSIVRSVKDQRQCGKSCHAFALIILIEAQYAFQHEQTMSMSQQQIIDCSKIKHRIDLYILDIKLYPTYSY
jgi:hypothetical protein